MKKRFLAVLVTGLFILGIADMANAALTTIGTVTYGDTECNLIWDNDNNGNSLVWLDYSNTQNYWLLQNEWAAGIDSSLTYNIDSAYTVTWDDAAWRLPSTGANPQFGYNQTTSEMGHLFYDELELSAFPPLTTTEQLNATNFDQLIASWYWSNTEYADSLDNRAWGFSMTNGYQTTALKLSNGHGLAVRSGQVSAVPIPAAVWLLGTGLAGLAALGKRKNRNRV